MKGRINKILMIFSLALVMALPRFAYAGTNAMVVEEKPGALAMTGDLVIARPVMLAVTVVGSAIYLVSLPFSLMGGNSGEAANELVLKPAANTFVRCLGCRNAGYKKSVEKVEGSE